MFMVRINDGDTEVYCDTLETANEVAYRYLIKACKEDIITEYTEKVSDYIMCEKHYTERPKSFKEFIWNIINDADWLEGYSVEIIEISISNLIITMENIDNYEFSEII